MEKTKYNKPEVMNMKMDFSINLQPQSPNSIPPENDAPTSPPDEGPVIITTGLFNPLKWFK